MTINKSKLMKRAWEIARNEKSFKSGKSKKPSLRHGLKWAWVEAKEEIAKLESTVASSKQSRYVSLLSTAENKHLNHGTSWYASGFDVDKNQLNPSWEGEKICYVYAA